MFVFYPLSDDNPTTRTPILTWALIGINVLIFLYQFSIGDAANNRLISDYGVRPSVFTDFNDLHTIITSAFLHADIWHLFFNMLFLYIYGDNIEAYLGRVNFMIFYALGGLSAALLQSMFSGGMDIPMIGASGCISAIMGAYWVLYPKAKINVFLWIFIFIQFIKVPASIVIGFWILEQLISAGNGSYDGVAYFAHIGGFIFGYIGIKFFFKEYVQYEEISESDLPISRKNKSQGLTKDD